MIKHLGFAGLTLLLLACNSNSTGLDPYLDGFEQAHLTISASAQAHPMMVFLAITPKQQAQGLMFVRELKPTHGMWFDFGQARDVGMWMKNTLIPLDILFVSEQLEVMHIAENTIPGSLKTIRAPMPVRYVLELNAGSAERLGIAPGAKIQFN